MNWAAPVVEIYSAWPVTPVPNCTVEAVVTSSFRFKEEKKPKTRGKAARTKNKKAATLAIVGGLGTVTMNAESSRVAGKV